MEAELERLKRQADVIERRLQEIDLPPSGLTVARTLLMESELIKSCHNGPRETWAYESYQDLVLDLGTAREGSLVLPEWCEPMQPQECFNNAFELVCTNPTLTYVEGYAMTKFMPMQHAWVEDQSGRIIDPTWAGLADGDDETAWYFGIRFESGFAIRRAREVGWASILASDWRVDAEILRLGLVMNDDNTTAIGIGEA